MNHYRFDPAALLQCRYAFDFDLFGSPLRSLAPDYPRSLAYRARALADCPPAPKLSVAAPPWNRLLPLLSGALADPGAIKGRVLMLLPLWPAQPWWPLAVQLAQGKMLTFRGKPWLSPAGKRANFNAVAVWLG